MSKAVRHVRTWYHRATRHTRGPDADRGASLIEYVGLIIIVAAIILAVRALNLDTAIATAIQGAVNNIIGG
ncbi:hypothetical protein [Streptomyces sp. HNM0574]|uniref:hypothetical protein n=1 Tax=Streptomyces sp. HNM0574 TaxID=2714954 RepID=UPI00146AF79B|nr:hypothetical protein [Streptomyces sp. HNM0574]NLU66640.1 hypothetical protein [Streptomyces sp. HNM0574]